MAKLIGTASADTKIGTDGIDQVFGLEGDDFLNGLGGADFLVGGGGVEIMQGGAGNDILFAQSPFVLDRVKGWFSPPPSDADFFASRLEGGDGNDILMGNAVLRGGAGNDILVGGNIIGSDGGEGDDTLINSPVSGGVGNDTYISTQAGIAGDDRDIGTDHFIVDGTFVGNLDLIANENDIVEFHNVAGINSVSDIQQHMQTVGFHSTVRVNEKMTVTFSYDIFSRRGPTLKVNETNVQAIFGQINARIAAAMPRPSSGNDVLFGDEVANTINGLQGADRMEGMGGNDTYIVDNVGDRAVESTKSGGIDLVKSSVTYVLGQYVDNLTLTGTGAINGTGNTLANRLTGNTGDNILDGKAGADTMQGGAGNDTYYVDNAGDVVTELANAGRDTVRSTISYTLTDNVERLALAGTGSINGTGNTLANLLTGNAGNNVLDGKAGADTMTGGGGSDAFVFSTSLVGGNIDTITDFSVGADKIRLSQSIFRGIGGSLSTSEFAANATGTARDSSDRIIYETDTGKLFYDANGSASGGAVQFAQLSPGLALSRSDFSMI